MRSRSRKPFVTSIALIGAMTLFAGCGDQGDHLPAGMVGASNVGLGVGSASGDLDDPVLAGYDGVDSMSSAGGEDVFASAAADWNDTEGAFGGLDDMSLEDPYMDAGWDDPGPAYGLGRGYGLGYGSDWGGLGGYGGYGGYGAGLGIASVGGLGVGGMMDTGFADPGFEDPGLMDAGLEDPALMDAGFEDPGFVDPGMDAGMADVGMDPGIVDPGFADVGAVDAAPVDMGFDAGVADVGAMDVGAVAPADIGGFDTGIAVF